MGVKNGKRGTMWKKIGNIIGKKAEGRAIVLASVTVVLTGILFGCGAKSDTVIPLDRVIEKYGGVVDNAVDGSGTAGPEEAGIAKAGITETGIAEAGRMEAGLAETGISATQNGVVSQVDAAGSSRENIIYVHVCGAVKEPGVVEIASGSRAQAAVEAAGGFREDADRDYVNLASLVSDGEQLYIPTLEEAGERKASQEAAESGLVNINTADVSRLCTLPGIGESRAGDIIAYRQEHGSFADIEEIMQVPGIKESTFEKLKNLITVK